MRIVNRVQRKEMKIWIILLFCLCSRVAFTRYTQECHSPEDCRQDECCVLGMMRFSTPVCKSLGQIGDVCLMYNEPEDKILSYPNGEVQAHGLYTLFCPCASSLHCVNASCSV